MLIEFSVKNFLSIWETQVLQMTAGPVKDLLEKNTFETAVKGLPRLLKSVVMYGPNGAGKSNLIAALDFMQDFVLNSSKDRQTGASIGRKPFRLHSDGPDQPSEFEIFFIQDGIRYQYGFACTDTRVTHEWLLAYPKSRVQRWFERFFNPETEKDDYSFGSKLLGPKRTWQDNTRPNALFLSTAVQLNSKQLKPVYDWFEKLAIIPHGILLSPIHTINRCQDEKDKERILRFMKNADISVDGIDIEEKRFTAEDLDIPSDMPPELQSFYKKETIGNTFKRAKFIHRMIDSDDDVSFSFGDESDGTQKLFIYAAPWLDLLNDGLVLVVDELDNSLHPHLVRFLLSLIHNTETNKANGQLIFATHDTSILDPDILRRDQIWFVEKDNHNASRFYSLSDFHPRKNEALAKGYLQGRYGALPYIGEVNF
ncbi:MAG: ATP-binding protein [Deltaproteobacteria bacterium]|nr:ATP-binding protein [Deltaproteobacteria bacterium]